ncbi:SMP-30/gluconolactonase/LRE family protein [Leifsonia sp. L25]|uniref:SMP-30/gluconolactonase/LRE family protein n=1 Tax=Actinomycetes TaxID=1760 RepID=UPI003D69BDEB
MVDPASSDQRPRTELQLLVPGEDDIGESPIWLPEEGRLVWVDMTPGVLNTWDGSSKTSRALGGFIGAVSPSTRGYVVATASGFLELLADGGDGRLLSFLDADHLMNDAKPGPDGRLWAGSLHKDEAAEQGALHVLDTDWGVRQVLTGLTLPNGLGWDREGRIFYLNDSVTGETFAFDFDPASGSISHKRVVRRFRESEGLPDGLAVDMDGCLWIALWGGSRIVRISPEGDLLREIGSEASQPASCAFGGPGLRELFVTTAQYGLDSPRTADGSLYRLADAGVSGVPVGSFRG